MSKVLITSNPLNHEGGVVNYYRTFLKHFKSDTIMLEHLPFGSRMEHFYSPWKKIVLYPPFYCFDLLRLIRKLLVDKDIKVVQVSPSLIPVPLLRDAPILLVAKLLGCRVIVFYRGWKQNIIALLSSNSLLRVLFKFIYNKADISIVLASQFKNDLVQIGWSENSVITSTTMYAKELILPATDRTDKRPRFLYLGRISHLKGIGELINAVKILADQNYDFECVIVGHGDRENVIEKYTKQIQRLDLANYITFTGRLDGREKYQAYAYSDIFVLPSWTEGCPNSVLEALGSGLFVISTDVGALTDIILEGINGRIVASKNHHQLAKALTWACDNITSIRKRRQAIREDAEKQYSTRVILDKFETIYTGLIDA